MELKIFPKIDASPTKEFFISILARDVNLSDAINDLVDNCIDGARRLRPDGNYSGLTIDITLQEDNFAIIDNCGGMSYEIARDYAFKFGRAADAPLTDGSIGKFGVGMKRALFKMGTGFQIESTSANSKFKIQEDVEAWKEKKDEQGRELWEFEFKELQTDITFEERVRGTRLSVSPLHEPISEEFKLKTFVNRLADSLQTSHEQTMEQGLEISVNDIQLKHKLANLLYSDKIRPLKIEIDYPFNPNVPDSAVDVKATIYAGISDADLAASGWHIICNGRQVLKADKSRITGWDESIDQLKIPKSHYQFSRFRGYVFFESSDAGSLPWNTSKSGVDTESRVYQAAKLEMIAAMRQVLDFLNKLDNELDSEDTFLQKEVSKAESRKLVMIPPSQIFVYPTPGSGQPVRPKVGRIAFTRAMEEIDFTKEFFEVSSAKLAGEKAFEYFLTREKE